MNYFSNLDLQSARNVDLLSYLRHKEPHELVLIAENTYCTREHDSLKISNGKWCWFSRGIGGRSALDYLIKVKGIPFTEAVGMILGRAAEMPPVSHIQGDSHQPKEKKLLLPKPVEGRPERVIAYLTSRGIDRPLLLASTTGFCMSRRSITTLCSLATIRRASHDTQRSAGPEVLTRVRPPAATSAFPSACVCPGSPLRSMYLSRLSTC